MHINETKLDKPLVKDAQNFVQAVNRYCSEVSSVSELLQRSVSATDIPSVNRLLCQYGVSLFKIFSQILDDGTQSESFSPILHQYCSQIEVYYTLLALLRSKHTKLCVQYLKCEECQSEAKMARASFAWLLFITSQKYYTTSLEKFGNDLVPSFSLLIASFYLCIRHSSASPTLSTLQSHFPNVTSEDLEFATQRVSTFLSNLSISCTDDICSVTHYEILLDYHHSKLHNNNLLFNEMSIYPNAVQHTSPVSKPVRPTPSVPLVIGLHSPKWTHYLFGSAGVKQSSKLVEALGNSESLVSMVEDNLSNMVKQLLEVDDSFDSKTSTLKSCYLSLLSNVLNFEGSRLGEDSSQQRLVSSTVFSKSLFIVSCCLINSLLPEMVLLTHLSITPIDLLPAIEAVLRSSSEHFGVEQLYILRKLEHKIVKETGFKENSPLFSSQGFRLMITGSGDSRIDFFVRKVIGMASNTIKNLGIAVNVESNPLLEFICTCFKSLLTKSMEVFKNRHLDSVVLCCFYSIFHTAFSIKNGDCVDHRFNRMATFALDCELSLEQLCTSYLLLPDSSSDAVTSVWVADDVIDHVICFYNTVFDPLTRDLLGLINVDVSPSPNPTSHTPFRGQPIPNYFSSSGKRKSPYKPNVKCVKLVFS
ncbi:hypothetical protein P9112_002266 [Eukaryota sp. TZLM1-RC]